MKVKCAHCGTEVSWGKNNIVQIDYQIYSLCDECLVKLKNFVKGKEETK